MTPATLALLSHGARSFRSYARRLTSCSDGMCGGCPRCGIPDPKPTDADLEDQAARQIDAEEAPCA